MMGPDAMIIVFECWILSQLFHSPLSSSSRGYLVLLAFYNKICTYLKLLIFLPQILISAYVSSSPAVLMMSSAYKLNDQGGNIQPWRTPFSIWNQSVVPCPVLTVASWPTYKRHTKRHKVVWHSHLFQNFPTVYYDPQSQRLWHSQ